MKTPKFNFQWISIYNYELEMQSKVTQNIFLISRPISTGVTSYFFRNKTFLFVKIEIWNFQHLFDLGFRENLQNFSSFRQTFRRQFSTGNKSCLNEPKSKSKRCWKFQVSTLTNKKVLFLKKNIKCTMYHG